MKCTIAGRTAVENIRTMPRRVLFAFPRKLQVTNSFQSIFSAFSGLYEENGGSGLFLPPPLPLHCMLICIFNIRVSCFIRNCAEVELARLAILFCGMHASDDDVVIINSYRIFDHVNLDEETVFFLLASTGKRTITAGECGVQGGMKEGVPGVAYRCFHL